MRAQNKKRKQRTEIYFLTALIACYLIKTAKTCDLFLATGLYITLFRIVNARRLKTLSLQHVA